MSHKKVLQSFILSVHLILLIHPAHAVEVPISDFSIKAYDQNIDSYFPPDSIDYKKPLVTKEYQVLQLRHFLNHYYSTSPDGLSPWSENLVQNLLPQVKSIEHSVINDFDNQQQGADNTHYGENFKVHDESWLKPIVENMNLDGLIFAFMPASRAIVVQNTAARALPDEAPDFFHLSIAGQGFPFDNLQESALWAGTPIYVLHTSRDKAWSLVLTPDAYFAWIKSSDLAYADTSFIKQWQTRAMQGLVAITKTQTAVHDEEGAFLLSSYIGSVFPLVEQNEKQVKVYIPIKNKAQQAGLAEGIILKPNATLMPLAATKEHFAQLIKALQNRPYGWGGAYFFNDCSQELKSLFTPLGIWLPRNSKQQAQYTAVDLSDKNIDARLAGLSQQGHPLMTLIYIGGHVMLYLGEQRRDNQNLIPLTYQNVWGLAPIERDKRFVIGQSLLLPLLKNYPEQPDARSLAGGTYFKLIYLDALQDVSMRQFIRGFSKAESAREAY